MSIRNHYQVQGVDAFYREQGDTYDNPHRQRVQMILSKLWSPLWKTGIDFACGDGLVTKFKRSECDFIGVDPHLAARYRHETNRPCFQYDAAAFIQAGDIPTVDVAVISYALDIIPKSYHSQLLWKLSTVAAVLIVIRPNSKVIEQQHWKGIVSLREQQTRGVVYTKKY